MEGRSPRCSTQTTKGIPGWRDDQVAGAVYGWLDTLGRVGSAPDVLLLHIGTNGLDENPGDVERILDEIDRFERSANHPVTVVLARIIPKANSAANLAMTTRFNDNVAAMAAATGR
jgi:lysophospholipase L1-like esterase